MSQPLLEREEYIEQAYFFRSYRERLEENSPAQEILQTIREEILATTKLPLALDFLYDEIKHRGKISDGMQRLLHYFTPFQSYVVAKAEEDRSKFDLKIALQILESEATYRTESPTPAGLFVYQFECLSRNRLGYDRGLDAIAADPFFDEPWKAWIRGVRRELGTQDFADFIFYHSEAFLAEQRRQARDPELTIRQSMLFGGQEGRIAKANRGKDPLYMFAALQRQLNYPTVPRPKKRSNELDIPPALQVILNRLEKRIQFLEMEASNSLDLSKFYRTPEELEKMPGANPPTDL
jgi:hypothetical protein